MKCNDSIIGDSSLSSSQEWHYNRGNNVWKEFKWLIQVSCTFSSFNSISIPSTCALPSSFYILKPTCFRLSCLCAILPLFVRLNTLSSNWRLADEETTRKQRANWRRLVSSGFITSTVCLQNWDNPFYLSSFLLGITTLFGVAFRFASLRRAPFEVRWRGGNFSFIFQMEIKIKWKNESERR